MSVLVKGMPIPDNCESCAFETGFGFCLAKSDNFCGYTNYRERPEWCPLVEVSEPREDEVNYKTAIDSACENDATKCLSDLIFDINPDEICEQIKSGNLRNWCVTIQTEMRMAMIQLPCWEEEDNDK